MIDLDGTSLLIFKLISKYWTNFIFWLIERICRILMELFGGLSSCVAIGNVLVFTIFSNYHHKIKPLIWVYGLAMIGLARVWFKIHTIDFENINYFYLCSECVFMFSTVFMCYPDMIIPLQRQETKLGKILRNWLINPLKLNTMESELIKYIIKNNIIGASNFHWDTYDSCAERIYDIILSYCLDDDSSCDSDDYNYYGDKFLCNNLIISDKSGEFIKNGKLVSSYTQLDGPDDSKQVVTIIDCFVDRWNIKKIELKRIDNVESCIVHFKLKIMDKDTVDLNNKKKRCMLRCNFNKHENMMSLLFGCDL